MRVTTSLATVAVILTVAGLTAGGFEPARLKAGVMPQPPRQAVSWEQALLDVGIDRAGRVEDTRPLRATPLLLEVLRHAVGQWRFEPAVENGRQVQARILVAAVFRPPVLFDTPGQGPPPVDLARQSEEIPFPTTIVPPAYPPRALGDGVVLVEVLVAADGTVTQAKIAQSAPGFDASATAAALRWSFRPARRRGASTPAFAYLLFGFRAPVVVGPRRLQR